MIGSQISGTTFLKWSGNQLGTSAEPSLVPLVTAGQQFPEPVGTGTAVFREPPRVSRRGTGGSETVSSVRSGARADARCCSTTCRVHAYRRRTGARP